MEKENEKVIVKAKEEDFLDNTFAALIVFLRLEDWNIFRSYYEDDEYDDVYETQVVGQLTAVDYMRNQAKVKIALFYVRDNWANKDVIISCVLHELLHIFTIAPLKVFEKEDSIRELIGKHLYCGVEKEMNIFNEQMNCRLERVMFELFKKTLAYEGLVK